MLHAGERMLSLVHIPFNAALLFRKRFHHRLCTAYLRSSLQPMNFWKWVRQVCKDVGIWMAALDLR